MATPTNTFIIAFYDALGELVAPTANFTPVSGFPLAALQANTLFASRCRTPDLTADRQLTWNFGSALAGGANVFMLAGTNASINATRRFRSATDAGFTAGIVQSSAALTAAFDDSLGSGKLIRNVQPWGRTLIYVSPTTFFGPYIRWHQTDAANTDGYMEWAIARVGAPFQPSGDFQSASWKASVKPAGAAGSVRGLRSHTLTFHAMNRSDAYAMQDYILASLGGRRVLVIPEGLNAETYLSDALWCEIETGRDYTRGVTMSTPDNRLYNVEVAFVEVEV